MSAASTGITAAAIQDFMPPYQLSADLLEDPLPPGSLVGGWLGAREGGVGGGSVTARCGIIHRLGDLAVQLPPRMRVADNACSAAFPNAIVRSAGPCRRALLG